MANDDVRSREFIGQGLHFPLTVDSRGQIAMTNQMNEIEQSIFIILETAPGERVMRPEFGCRAWELLFDPRGPTMEATLVSYVEEALLRWEPRINVTQVAILPPTVEDQEIVRVHITYEIKNTHDKRSIVYPFYIMNEPDSPFT